MKWLNYSLISLALLLASCKDPVTFRKPSATEVTKFNTVPVGGLSGSFLNGECAVFLNVKPSTIPEAGDEMIVDGAEGPAVVGYLHAIDRDALVVSIPFRGADGVSSRKSVSIPKRYIRELRMK